MEIPVEVEWVSPVEQGAVAARILEPREFMLTPTTAIAGHRIRDIEPGGRPDLYAFFLENQSDVSQFSTGQLIDLQL